MTPVDAKAGVACKGSGAADLKSLLRELGCCETLPVRELDLRTVDGDEQLRRACKLVTVASTLRRVRVTGITLTGDQQEAVAQLLRNCSTVESLRLEHSGTPHRRRSGAKLEGWFRVYDPADEPWWHRQRPSPPRGPGLDTLLCHNDFLRRLHLQREQEVDQSAGIHALALALRQNHPVRSLELTNCGLTARSAETLADALRVNTTLRNLCLVDNRFQEAGVLSLVRALTPLPDCDSGLVQPHNSSLQTLDVRLNPFQRRSPPELIAALTTLLQRNRSLERFLLDSYWVSPIRWLRPALRHNGVLVELFGGFRHALLRPVERNRQERKRRMGIRRVIGAWRTAINVKKYKRYLWRRKRR